MTHASPSSDTAAADPPTAALGPPSCVVLLPSIDPNLVDHLLDALKSAVPPSTTTVARSNVHIHVFRPVPRLASALSPSTSLTTSAEGAERDAARAYVLEVDVPAAQHDRIVVYPHGISSPKTSVPAPFGTGLAMVSTMRNLWTARQTARIAGATVDVRDVRVTLGQVYVAGAFTATVASVTYKLAAGMHAAKAVSEFVNEYILARVGEGVRAAAVVSRVSAEPVEDGVLDVFHRGGVL
ncbi:hypothetical protein H9P43_005031 [Blastocladiella emersonii ATCC 22665]|nr:hypothetical protein H9P43_005031 [Blastocladiella emersonii ATCC 22665]